MRKASIVRLALILAICALTMTAVPSYAFPACPLDSCSYYSSLCQEDYQGVPSRTYEPGWCQDELYYLRGYGMAYCTSYGMTYEFGPCADY
jgi:hypothetical protein